ncbi:uncharacterized protein LOC141601278 [Silene latifolia]|uniref:uncharacterized protein LOC141601278 n=1 Tax=Silene latifolia TaxID=37657 RepID=UPI003D787729
MEDEADTVEEPEAEISSEPSQPLLQFSKEDVAGANPPSNVIIGFVKRVWQANGVDKISFLPNRIFLVRFKTMAQQQMVLNNRHLIFDNKPVIINEWKPDVELVKYDVSKIPIWMKIYGLDIKFWGLDCLRKLGGCVGQFIKCDDATSNKAFLGYARVMIEVKIGQQFPTELPFMDENGKPQCVRLAYDWLPTTCTGCKGMGHTVDVCRKGEPKARVKKVWVPKNPQAPIRKNPTNNNCHKGGRVWLIWDPTMFSVDVRDITDQCIHAAIRDRLRKKNFCITMVYGFNKQAERESLWHSLRKYYGTTKEAWVVCGDFNTILDTNERIGGSSVTLAEMTPFLQVVQDCELYEISACGSYYIWNNKHEEGDKIYSRIDRVLINEEWLQVFGTSFATYLPEGLFDHCPCVIQFEENTGSKMFKVVQKLKGLKQKLKELNKEQFSDIENLTHITELSLKHFQESLRSDPLNTTLCDAERECAKELKFLIKEVQSVNGKVIRNSRCLNERHNAILLAPISDEEVKVAMFGIPGNKSPGPDGYSSQFFKDSWHILGKEITEAIKDVFNSGKLLKQCNNTIITLVPKVDIPETVMQFRPIACCNTVYKCLSKVICSRLKKILPDIISPFQSAFVAGRDIVGNILICQDLIQLYKRKTCSLRILMKLDLQKAYDSVEWSFVHEMLIKVGFPEQMVKLIMECISSPSYSISLNGETFGFFKGMNRGKVPFKYLGVNVSSKRLSVLYCAFLVEKVVDRIRGMGSRHLSYDGRIVLIKSVFSTLHNYWARIFILPRTVLKQIEAVCRDYLYHGKDIKSSPALVAWEKICRPKRQGGMGFKDLVTWNTAALGKYVWWVEKKADHLWVKWVKEILKDLMYGNWRQGNVHYTIRAGYSWLRPEVAYVDCHPWILNRWLMPKQCFIGWLIIQQRLRIVIGGLVQCTAAYIELYPMVAAHSFQICMNRCYVEGVLLCPEKLVDQVKLDVRNSKADVSLIQDWCGAFISLSGVMTDGYGNGGGKLKQQVYAITLNACTYHICAQRNSARINGILMVPSLVVQKIIEVVRQSIKFKCNAKLSRREEDWLDRLGIRL